MATKALIFAGSYNIYADFIKEYRLKKSECKYVRDIWGIQGYHKDTNPDLLFIFLDGFWLTPIGNSDELTRFTDEFDDRIYHEGIAEAAARLIQLSYITDPEMLPEYLAHENEEVREAARVKQQELSSDCVEFIPCIGDYSETDYACVTACLCREECREITIKSAMSKHFTKPPPKTEGKTKHVRGAPVKITRGRVGSHGKSVEEELVDMPDKRWVEPEELEVFAGNKGAGITSGFGKWVAPLAEQVERIDEAENVGELSEGLANEHEIVRDKADKKLRELRKDQKEKSRFDIIDLEGN